MTKDQPGWLRRNANRVINPDEQTEAQARRAPWILLTAVLVLVVLAIGVWALRVFVFEPSQQTATPPAAAPTASATSPQQSEAAPVTPEPTMVAGDGCSLNNTNQDITNTPPTATRWIVERWAVLPEVSGAGPCFERDGYRAGFAHTQTGAVLAAYHYLVHGNTASPDAGTRGLLDYAVLEGPLKAAILQDVDDVENGVKVRVPDSDFAGAVLQGYRIVGYESNTAVIEVSLGKEGASSGSLTAKLVWQDGDWRIDPASANEWSSPARNVPTQGFVLWSSSGTSQ